MSELEEVAMVLVPGYLHWIDGTPRGNCMAAAKEYTRQQMLDETESVQSGVAYALFRITCPLVNR